MARERDDRLVRVAVFSNEPLARMWEDRLRGEGVPTLAHPLGAGAALGTSVTSPHALMVSARDAERALSLLEGEPEARVPLEVMERESPQSSSSPALAAVAIVVVVAVLTGLTVRGPLSPWVAVAMAVAVVLGVAIWLSGYSRQRN